MSINIYPLQSGTVKVDQALPFYKSPIAFTGLFSNETNKMILPVSVYLIVHPKGTILFDTGWSKEIRLKKNKAKFEISPGSLPDGQAVDEQLAQLGYQPSDIDYVVMSHLDGDHVGGLVDLKDAKNFFVSNQEIKATTGMEKYLRYNAKYWQDIPFKAIHFSNRGIGPKNASYDLFGDGSVQTIWTPGHSQGMMSLMISNDEDQFVLLVGDVGYMARSWEEMIIPGIVVNKNDALKSLRWVKEMSESSRCIAVLANHDPDVKRQVISL